MSCAYRLVLPWRGQKKNHCLPIFQGLYHFGEEFGGKFLGRQLQPRCNYRSRDGKGERKKKNRGISAQLSVLDGWKLVQIQELYPPLIFRKKGMQLTLLFFLTNPVYTLKSNL